MLSSEEIDETVSPAARPEKAEFEGGTKIQAPEYSACDRARQSVEVLERKGVCTKVHNPFDKFTRLFTESCLLLKFDRLASRVRSSIGVDRCGHCRAA